MSDNLAITQGTGTTIAADDIGGVLHQRVKISQGADGVGVDVSASAPLQVTLANNGANAVPVAITQLAATRPSATTMQSGAVASGNGTNLAVTGYATALLSVVSSVTMSGGTTINFEASSDDTTWVPVTANKVGSTTLSNTTTVDGDFQVNIVGYKSVRARISAYSAGTIGVLGYVLAQPFTPTVLNIATIPQPTPPTAVVAFITAVTTAGTRVQLASNAINGAILQAPSTNSGLIYVGVVTVSATVYGAELQPGQATSVAVDNTSKIYIDSSVNGDKCAVLGS